MRKLRLVLSCLVLIGATGMFGQDIPDLGNRISRVDRAWPSKAEHQQRRMLVDSDFCEADDCGSLPTLPTDPTNCMSCFNPCLKNYSCQLITKGACQSRTYSRCKNNPTNSVQPCEAC